VVALTVTTASRFLILWELLLSISADVTWPQLQSHCGFTVSAM